NWGPFSLDFSPDGRLLASSDVVDGIQLWDTSAGVSIARLPDEAAEAVLFRPDGSALLTGSPTPDRGPALWPIRTVAGGLRTGPPRWLSTGQSLFVTRGTWDATGRYLVIKEQAREQAVVMDVDRQVEVARLGPHPSFNQLPISPDGRWV